MQYIISEVKIEEIGGVTSEVKYIDTYTKAGLIEFLYDATKDNEFQIFKYDEHNVYMSHMLDGSNVICARCKQKIDRKWVQEIELERGTTIEALIEAEEKQKENGKIIPFQKKRKQK